VPFTTPSTETPKPSLLRFGGQQSATSTTAPPSFAPFGATPAKSVESSFSFGGSSGFSTAPVFDAVYSTPFGSAAFVAPAAAPTSPTFVFGAPTASETPQAPTFRAVPNYSVSDEEAADSTTDAGLRKPKRAVTEEVSCLCGMSFRTKDALKHHFTAAHKEKPAQPGKAGAQVGLPAAPGLSSSFRLGPSSSSFALLGYGEKILFILSLY